MERARPARPSGRHVLRSSALADELVRGAAVRPGELALDLGAGSGMITAALVRADARVRAVELDAALAATLRRRFPSVEVIRGDATRVGLPAGPFVVVANLPFAAGTGILRALLNPVVPLRRAELVVQWGLAAKRCAVWPSTILGVYWGAWHELTLIRRLPPCVFAPPPSVDAAVLRVVRRAEPLVPPGEAAAYDRFLRRGFRVARIGTAAPHRTLRRLALEHGFDPRARPIDLDARQWAAVYHAVRRLG